MIHESDHDPLRDYRVCWSCYQGLSAAFAELAHLRIDDHDERWLASLIATLRKVAERQLEVVK